MHSTFKAVSRLLTAAGLTLLCTFSWTCGGDKVVGPSATQLAFAVGPAGTTGGATLAPALKVEARDASGNVVVTYAGNITVALGTNPGSGALSGTKTAAAVSGVATFADLSVDKVGTGYTLTAAASSLTGATSAAFNITPGPAAQLSFSSQPSNATAGVAIAPAVTVTAQDLGGNPSTGFSGSISVTITGGTGAAGATLSGTTTATAAAGVALFSTLSVDKSGAGYTLSAASGGLTTGTSSAFAVSAGPAAQLAFTVQPSTTVAGVAINPSVKATAQDAFGNTVTGFSSNITVAITGGTGTAGATLSGTTTIAAASGIATFAGLSIDKAGRTSQGTGYTLTASSGVLTNGTSDPFDINVGAPASLAFSSQPVTSAAGSGFAPLVTVSALDAVGNVVTTFTANISVAIGTNPVGATLGGTATVAAIGGVATFSTVHIDKVGAGFTLSASAAGVTDAASSAFDITPGPEAELVFTGQPVTTSDAVPIAPAVKVTARDGFGNVATQFAGNVTMAIAANPASGALSGSTTLAASAGVATFADLVIDNIGNGYTLMASASGVIPDTSVAFDIVASAADRLAFTAQPVTTGAGATIAPAIAVCARDLGGQPVATFTGNVTLAITSGTGTGGAGLTGTATVAAVGGCATFSDLSINTSGTGYTFTASATALTSAISAPFGIDAGTATQLEFAVEPGAATAATTITPQIEVVARDAQGNVADGFTGNVTVAIASNPSGGTLSGTATVAAVAGVAAFTNLSINLAGVGYTLSASATGPAGATTAAFDVSAAAASNLVFTVEPASATAGAVIAPAVQVTAKDGVGNVQTSFTGNVTLTITGGSGTAGAILSGTSTVAAVAGVATFSTLNIDKAGIGYALSASATGLSGATSTAFDINPGVAAKLAFTVEPASVLAGGTISTEVTAQDASGNTVPTFTGSITVIIGVNPGSATLGGTTAVNAVAGVATFSTLGITTSGLGYTLLASSGALTGATSAPFDVTAAAASQLVFTVQPSTSAAGVAIAPIIDVAAKDAFGNTATGFLNTVTMSIGTNPPGTGVLSGTQVVAAVAGVAQFSTLNINRSGLGYTLSAAATGLTTAVSAPFTITPGAATILVFSVQPSTATTGANIAPAVKVASQDALGNVATGFNGNVTVSLGANPGGSALSGTKTLAAVNGVATYQGLSLNNIGTGYTLTAAAGGLTGATSALFNIIASVGTQLFFTVQPPNTAVAGATIPSILVTARDASGQTASNFNGNVTVAITSGTGAPGAGLSGTLTKAAVAGVVSFDDLSINKSAVGYKLTATATALTSTSSAFFTINPGAATQLVFTLQPSTATMATSITPKVEVTARDAQGNTATGFIDSVTVAIGTNPSGGVLAGAVKVAAVGGIASFSTLNINLAGTGYTLTAASGVLAGATSAPFDITSTLATQLTFSTQPSTATAGAVIAPAVKVTARNSSGGVATGFTGNVTVTITANTGTAGSTLSGTVTKAAVAGIATFSDLSIDNSGTGFRLSSTAAGVSGATSNAFTINAGAAARVSFTVQPGSGVAATFIPGATGPTIQVTTRDALGNPVKTYTGNVTVALAANPPGGTLGGSATVAAVAGVTTFNNLTLDKSGAGYRLVVTALGLAPDTSDAFSVSAGAATQLLFTVQPSSVAAGVLITPAMRVTALDAQGNVATSFVGNVTLAIATNPSGGTLSGTQPVAAVNGVAVFTGFSINLAGLGYVLKTSAAGLTDGLSAIFNIN